MKIARAAISVNRLIEALPRKDRLRLLAACEPVELAFAEVLAKPGEDIRDVFFPTTSYISLVTPVGACSSLEVGLVGDEGMLGIALVLGVRTSPLVALVQGDGLALRLDAAQFCRELEVSRPLHGLLKRYVHAVMSQLAQSAVCTRFHVVEERLARCLLMTHDRAHSDAFCGTHEFLAYLLGVRRVGVTRAANSLKN